MDQVEAAAYVGTLSDYYGVPKPVLENLPENPNNLGYFGQESWTIFMTFPCEKEKLRHEFFHYLIALVRRGEKLEEDMADVYGSYEEEGI